MINIYKYGGKFKKIDGTEYSVKTINASDKSKYLLDGWKANLDDIEPIEYAEFEEVKKPKSRARKTTAKG